MVFLHELAHALHHLMLDLKPRENLGDQLEAEKLAQHFTMTCIEKYGNRANEVFLELENHQPPIYKGWRDLGQCEWENCKSQYEKNEEVKIYNKFKHLSDDDQNTASDLLDV